MLRPICRVSQLVVGFAAIAIAVMAGCASDHPRLSQVSVRAPLSSATSTVVFAQVVAVQDGETTKATVGSGDDSATLSLRVGLPATITGTVFTFETGRWRAFTSTQTVTPEVGSSALDLTLIQTPGITGTVVPTVTVRGVPQGVLGEILPLTLHDVDTDFVATTPFTTDSTIELPAGRSIVFSVPDRFSGGNAELPLATATFGFNTPLPLALDASINVAGLDVDGLEQTFPVLEANGLGLECAVDADCGSSTFLPCSAAGIRLATERSYTVAVRYAQVPGSCAETRITRDLTPPSFSTTTEPLFVQTGLTSLTMTIDANEGIVGDSVFVTVGGETTNRCAPSQLSPTRVRCALNLAGLNLASDVFFGIDLTDLSGQHALRVLRVRARDVAQNVQVVGMRTLPDEPSYQTYSMLVGITVAAFDGQPLCGIGPQALTFEKSTAPTVTFPSGGETWRGPNPVPAKAVGVANVATYWTRIYPDDALPGDYSVTGPVSVAACGARGVTTAPLVADLTFVDKPARWMTPGPIVVSPLQNAGWTDSFPVANLLYDGVTSSDPSVVSISSSDGQNMTAFKPGRARITTVPDVGGKRTPAGSTPASVDFEVVGSPEILAVQDGRLVRRGRASDTVTLLPSSLSYTSRVFWDSERELIAVMGESGVWIQAKDGSTRTVLHPCGEEVALSGALTSTVPRHPSAAPNLALVVGDVLGTHRTHCELDLATGAVAANIPLTNAACPSAGLLANDALTGRFFAAGVGCVFTYRLTSPTALTVLGDAFVDGGSLPQSLRLDTRSATALILVAGSVYAFSLTDDTLAPVGMGLQRAAGGAFAATAIAIDPVTGTPWVAGRDSGINGSVYLAFSERTGTAPAWIDVQRTDPSASTLGPSILLFDPGSNAVYSSRNQPSFSSTAASLAITYSDLQHNASIATRDYPIRAWPDALDVLDMVMVGPQPIGMSVNAAAPGQRVTIIGSGFNGGGRDEVFVQGVAANVVSSTRDSIVFVVPESLAAYAGEAFQTRQLVVGVRSSGLLSGPVPARGSMYATTIEFAQNALELLSILPGQFLDTPTASASTCSATCNTGAAVTLVDTIGRAGVLAMRPADGLFGVQRLAGNVPAEAFASRGLALPVRIPGQRRVIGVAGTNLVDQLAAPYDYSGTGQPVPPQRQRAITAAFSALAPSPDGEMIAGVAGSTLSVFHGGDLRAHPAGALGGFSADRIVVSSAGLVIGAANSGTITAARLTETSLTALPTTTDTSCPTGARLQVLALVADARGADVVAVTQYAGSILAVEDITDGGTTVAIACRSVGPGPSAITTAVADNSGSRLVVVSGALSILYDMNDMRLPMAQAALPATPSLPASAILRDRGYELYYTNSSMQYFTQQITTP